jgi:hypothetical protein
VQTAPTIDELVLPVSTPAPEPTTTPLPPSPTPEPAAAPAIAAVRVANLDGTSLKDGNQWRAQVTITVVDANNLPAANAVVSTSNNYVTYTENNSCTTNSSGQCIITSPKLGAKTNFATITVTNVSRGSDTYTPDKNADPDGDSNGTVIIVNRPN